MVVVLVPCVRQTMEWKNKKSSSLGCRCFDIANLRQVNCFNVLEDTCRCLLYLYDTYLVASLLCIEQNLN